MSQIPNENPYLTHSEIEQKIVDETIETTIHQHQTLLKELEE